MTKARSTRLSSVDRREAIIQAAAFVFAEHGFAGATTQAIAKRAGISEALLYRHFASKQALYRAVWRMLLRLQDEDLSRVPAEQWQSDLFGMMRYYFYSCLTMRIGTSNAMAHRLLMFSLASDGRYARYIYRRALRLRLPFLAAALERAVEEGHLSGRRIDPVNAFSFINHVGGMLSLGRMPARPLITYAGDNDQLVEEALLFCMRGLGFNEDYIESAIRQARGAPSNIA